MRRWRSLIPKTWMESPARGLPSPASDVDAGSTSGACHRGRAGPWVTSVCTPVVGARSWCWDEIRGELLHFSWRPTVCKRRRSSAEFMQNSFQVLSQAKPLFVIWAAQTAHGFWGVDASAHKTWRWRSCAAEMSFLSGWTRRHGKKALTPKGQATAIRTTASCIGWRCLRSAGAQRRLRLLHLHQRLKSWSRSRIRSLPRMRSPSSPLLLPR
mmetsp:Transcript_29871/g.62480  ORF Transcript_29871/g.62480 Transcript_29871/m.62480 type:complete len:212 (+) Transcript_29871:329-964(+)